MENEMIERAIAAAMSVELASALPGTTLSRAGAAEVVRAVFEAVRELPESLWDDGGALDPDVIGYDPSPTTSWQTIIDAALGIAKHLA